ncbi:hypothetical protein TNIN_68101 [Trichonephila inaurata madagascariensis]|uniref:Uncharacterized protein n=1 Tax=Trichonephila inaurata madagascariensis TaxID=2747483 RepID=A0A8X7BXZ7_9ARAC|nr:hypothetical protein TNIN_68101 [Trichonephila inaurata madagascariensis]
MSPLPPLDQMILCAETTPASPSPEKTKMEGGLFDPRLKARGVSFGADPHLPVLIEKKRKLSPFSRSGEKIGKEVNESSGKKRDRNVIIIKNKGKGMKSKQKCRKYRFSDKTVSAQGPQKMGEGLFEAPSILESFVTSGLPRKDANLVAKRVKVFGGV